MPCWGVRYCKSRAKQSLRAELLQDCRRDSGLTSRNVPSDDSARHTRFVVDYRAECEST